MSHKTACAYAFPVYIVHSTSKSTCKHKKNERCPFCVIMLGMLIEKYINLHAKKFGCRNFGCLFSDV